MKAIANRLFLRGSVRYFTSHPWQTVSSILGVALGVAVVVGIDLSNESAHRAFKMATNSVVGMATHQVEGGPAGLPEELYREIRVKGQIRAIAPVVEKTVGIVGRPGMTLHLLGVDVFAEAGFRPYLSVFSESAAGDLFPILVRPATGIITAKRAQQVGVRVGDTLSVTTSTIQRNITIVGLLGEDDTQMSGVMDNLLLTDIATAQELLNYQGRLSRIDVLAPPGPSGVAMLEKIRAMVPSGVRVSSAQGRSQALEQMTKAFRLNLTALSLLALVVGIFLIYNTMMFAVVQRRRLIGLWRAQGVTTGQLRLLILGEAFVLGVLGTAAGVGLGVVLASSLTHLITRTITDLYFVVSVRDVSITLFGVGKGIVLGVGGSLLAAAIPAREAMKTQPRDVMNRSHVEGIAMKTAPQAAGLGLCTLLIGLGGLYVSAESLWLSFGALFVVLFGAVLMTPLLAVACIRAIQPILSMGGGLLGRMCGRGIESTLSRTAVAVSALMIAVSVTVGVGIMVESFRDTVVQWLRSSLLADIYVAPPGFVSRRSRDTLDHDLVERMVRVPGVADVSTYRGITVESEFGPSQLVAAKLTRKSFAAYRFLSNDTDSIWGVFRHGDSAIISEPYAYRHRLGPGSVVRLNTDRGRALFRIVGVFTDYGSDQGIIVVSRATYNKWWEDFEVSSLGIYAEPGVSVIELVAQLSDASGEGHHVIIRSNRALLSESLSVFDRTFAITSVLHLLTTVVAFVGVLSALMALQLERQREFGVLRAIGFTPQQVWRLMTAQTGLMGLVAGVLAVPVGIGLAGILVFVINRRSFGWTLQLSMSTDILLEALVMSTSAALLAGIYPAFKTSRISPAIALREE